MAGSCGLRGGGEVIGGNRLANVNDRVYHCYEPQVVLVVVAKAIGSVVVEMGALVDHDTVLLFLRSFGERLTVSSARFSSLCGSLGARGRAQLPTKPEARQQHTTDSLPIVSHDTPLFKEVCSLLHCVWEYRIAVVNSHLQQTNATQSIRLSRQSEALFAARPSRLVHQ